MGHLRSISLFSGVGGLDLAARWAGIETVCYVEHDRYAQGVLMSRMRAGDLDAAPIWDDVTTFRGAAWRGTDIVSGGFPCQDVSFAGKRAGLKPGTRSGLWNHFARIVREVRPRFVLVENVPGLLSLGLGQVLGDLAEIGMDAKWGVWGAADVGAPHRRQRVWIIADASIAKLRNEPRRSSWSNRKSAPELGYDGQKKSLADTDSSQWRKKAKGRRDEQDRNDPGRKEASSRSKLGSQDVANADQERLEGWPGEQRQGRRRESKDSGSMGDPVGSSKDVLPKESGSRSSARESSWWSTEPDVGRVAHGVAARVDRLRCCGNGVVPQQALLAWEEILRMEES